MAKKNKVPDASPYYDDILSLCWDNDIFIYPLHIVGDRFNIEVFNKERRDIDVEIYTQDKAKIKILEYYKFYYNKLVI